MDLQWGFLHAEGLRVKLREAFLWGIGLFVILCVADLLVRIAVIW